MNTREIEKIINSKRAEAIREAKKNRLAFRIISAILLAVCVGMIGFGIDFLVHADKITGGILLGLGVALLGTVITIKVFTERKMALLLEGLAKIGTEEITAEDIKEAEEEEIEDAIFASTIDTADGVDTDVDGNASETE